MGLGTYRDFTNATVGQFTVLQLAGRDNNGSPVWRVRCRCGFVQPFSHSQLKNASETGQPENVLFCRNARCTHSKPQPVRTETLADIRRAEQEEQRRIEQEAAQLKAEADRKAAEESALRDEQRIYMRFAQNQIARGAELKDILPFDRWMSQSEEWRQNVLRRVGLRED